MIASLEHLLNSIATLIMKCTTTIQKSDEEWKRQLTSEQYAVMRQGGTEAPYSGELLQNNESGLYACVACGAELFDSDVKYESKEPGLAGWPSFYDAKPGAVVFKDD